MQLFTAKQKIMFLKSCQKHQILLGPPPNLRRELELFGNTKYVKNVKIEETKSRLEQLLERFHYFYIFENIVFVLLLLGRACFQKLKLLIL